MPDQTNCQEYLKVLISKHRILKMVCTWSWNGTDSCVHV